jgi:Ferric reductase like transmembrane component
MIALQSSQTLWYSTRATGFVALILLTASLVLGITQVTRWTSPRFPRFVTAALHKNVSLLVLAFLAIHIVTAIADEFAPIGWRDVVIPFQSPYRPLWLGFGTVAVDLLLALTVTSLLRSRVGYRSWRIVHWSSYACWPLAFLHGLGTGTDTKVRWSLYLSLACLAMVVAAIAWRLATATEAPIALRAKFATATGAVVVALLAWTLAYPTQSGWAQRAGTPPSLLGGVRNASASSATALRPPFDAALTGTVRESPVVRGRATITIDVVLRGRAARLSLSFVGIALAGGGVVMDRGVATLGTLTRPAIYSGAIVSLNGSDVTATVRDAAGNAVALTTRLIINPARTTVTGSVSAH